VPRWRSLLTTPATRHHQPASARTLNVACASSSADALEEKNLAGFRDLADDGHAEVQRLSGAPQPFRVARAALAEAEIVATTTCRAASARPGCAR